MLNPKFLKYFLFFVNYPLALENRFRKKYVKYEPELSYTTNPCKILFPVARSRSSRSEVLLVKVVLKICRRTPMPKFDFNKVALQLYWNHFSAWCSPVNLLHICRTPFTKNISEWLLLKILGNRSKAFRIFKKNLLEGNWYLE